MQNMYVSCNFSSIKKQLFRLSRIWILILCKFNIVKKNKLLI